MIWAMNKLRSLSMVSLLLAVGCSAPAVSTVNFRSPPGSELVFQDEDGLGVATVTFPASLELIQFASAGDEGRPFKGTLRVNGLVEEERIPSKARSILVEGEGGVDIPVKGWYRVFERETGETESLTVHPLEVSTEQLLLIMQGKPAQISAGEEGVLQLQVGLDLDVEKASDSE